MPFKDLKSIAANFWGQGVELELKRENKKKNNAEWASKEDIFKGCNIFSNKILQALCGANFVSFIKIGL